MPRAVNLDRLVKKLAERNITVVTGKSYYLTDFLEKDKFLRISVCRADPLRIEEEIKAIVEEVGSGLAASRHGRMGRGSMQNNPNRA